MVAFAHFFQLLIYFLVTARLRDHIAAAYSRFRLVYSIEVNIYSVSIYPVSCVIIWPICVLLRLDTAIYGVLSAATQPLGYRYWELPAATEPG